MEHSQPYQPRLELFTTRSWRPHVASERRPEIVTGGQTGIDRAAQDAALALGLPTGGWSSGHYSARARQNVNDSDATLILTLGALDSGSMLTADIARRLGKPCLVVQLDAPDAVEKARAWIAEVRPGVLNVAGSRESKQPGIYGRSFAFLSRIFRTH